MQILFVLKFSCYDGAIIFFEQMHIRKAEKKSEK